MFGRRYFSISSSERVLADCLYSGTELGIHPTSGLFGEQRFSLVVIISSPLLFVTIILRTFVLSRENDFTLTRPDHPLFVKNSNGDDIITTKEHLLSLNNPYVGWIPSSVPKYKQSAKNLRRRYWKNHVAQTFVTVAAGVFERLLQAQPSSIYDYVTAI